MILSTTDIVSKIKNPKPIMLPLKEEHKKLLMHVHGIGKTEYLVHIEGLENPSKVSLRKRLARSNKDLFADILRPTDKIFSADGGSKFYQFKNKSDDKKKEALLETLADIKSGYSLTEWLETYFIDKYTVDPNGVFLVENDSNKAYPTYKSILTIRDYEQNGRNIEYIIFEPQPVYTEQDGVRKVDYELYRVYDDSGDYTYKLQGDNLTLVEEFDNIWGYVPAITCSDRVNTITDYKQSTIYEQVELADEYLREGSIKTIYKYHHGFPLFWMYMSTCPSCKGLGTINRTNNAGESENSPCPVCNGTGWAIKKDVSDVKAIKPPENTEEPTITPDVAGYVVPPIESLNAMTEEQKLLRDMIFFSHWGVMLNREENEKTAFEVAVNIQPIEDRLDKYSRGGESTEKLLTNIIGEFEFQDQFEGSSINYGRNYIIKSPTQILNAYLEDKKNNASYTVLNDRLVQYYRSLYAHDQFNIVVSLKLIQVEPFVHNTITEVAGWNISKIDFSQKLYYNDWLSTIDKDYLFKTEVEKLKSELMDFTKLKIKENGEQTNEVQGTQSVEP